MPFFQEPPGAAGCGMHAWLYAQVLSELCISQIKLIVFDSIFQNL